MNFETYLLEIEPDIMGKAKQYSLSGMDWEDVAQELRIQLWQKFSNFNPQKASFRTWANRIMSNKLKDLLRDKENSHDALDEAISIDEMQENGQEIADTENFDIGNIEEYYD